MLQMTDRIREHLWLLSPHLRRDEKPSRALPYCSDPNCEYCKDLRAMREAMRLHRPDQSGPIKAAHQPGLTRFIHAAMGDPR
jgi:hypothetical protein